MTTTNFNILVLNQVSQTGLKRLPAERYKVGKDLAEPHAILLRSHDLHGAPIPPSILAVGRAGAGTNNIPVQDLSQRGVPVFNTPGANANAVKELVLAGMLMAARNLPPAIRFVDKLEGVNFERDVEAGKKQFAGVELPGHTLGVVGLGKIGSLVADAALKLGMDVLGYDPEITVEAAWSLSSQVRKAHSIEEVLKHSHFVSLHVPLVDATRGLVNKRNLALTRKGCILLNFSREQIVDEDAVASALESGALKYYVSDFPSPRLIGHPHVVALPHLGASTHEAEENCAVMVVDQVREYLEHGNIRNSVNFPNADMPRESRFRVGIAHSNVPNMVAQISSCVGCSGLNIHNMLNKSRGNMAYTLLDVDSAVPPDAIASMQRIDGVLTARYLPQP